MKNLRNAFAISMVCTSLITATACNNGSQNKESKDTAKEQNDKKFNNNAAEKDAQFVVDAVTGSYNEVAIDSLALHKSMNSEVKKLAQDMKTDHENIIKDLTTLAGSKAISIPSGASSDFEKTVSDYAAKKNDDFDKDWLNKLKDLHEATIKKYEDASANATDQDIKTWATATLSKIRNHYSMITMLQDKMKK